MKNLVEESQCIEKSLQEFVERKKLLGSLLEEKHVREFEEIKSIKLVKELNRRGSCFYAYNDDKSEMVITMYHFEVETEYEPFIVTLEFTDFERHKFPEDFFIWHHVYELYTPEVNQHHTEQLAEKIVAFLKEKKSFGNHDTVYVLHAFKPLYSKKELSDLDRKRFIKEFKKNESIAYDLIELHGPTDLPLDYYMDKTKERKDNNTERFMRELAFIEEDIQQLTERQERLTQLLMQEGVQCFNQLKSITPIEQSVWWSNYYYDFQSTEFIDLDYFEVETEHETFLIALEWAGSEEQFTYKPIHIHHNLYELHAPNMSQDNTEQIAEKIVSYIDERHRSKPNIRPGKTIFHILHAFKRTYEEKVLTELEQKRLMKNKTLYEAFVDSLPDFSSF